MSAPSSRIAPPAGPAQAPGVQDGPPPPLPLEAEAPGLPPAAGGPPPLAVGPTAVDFSRGEFRERFDSLVDFALTPPPPPPAVPPLATAASRLDATSILCQQMVSNHAAARYFLTPEGRADFFRRLLTLDAERRLLIVDSLVDIVRSGREPEAAANIVDCIQKFAISYLNNDSEEVELESADQILPRLVQRVMERDSGNNRDPMWIRLVATANLFGRPMRGQEPHTGMALALHASAGGRALPSDEACRAALGRFNSADPDNSPLARVLNSNPAADDLKGLFRKLAYGAERTRGGVAAVRPLIAEYPEALYVVPNRIRVVHVLDQPAGVQAVFRDRYFLFDPDPRVLSNTLSKIRDVLTEFDRASVLQGRLDVWQLLQANLNRLNNHPSPEVRSATSDLIMHVALHAQDSEVAVAAKSLLSVRQRIVFVDAIGIGDFLRSSGPGLTIVGKVVHYVVCAPGLIVGGLFGLIGGFFKGIFTGRNPFETAINMAIDSAFVGSMLIIAAVAATIGVVGFIALVAAAVPAVALPLMLMLPLLIIENQNLVPSFLRPGRGGSNGGTLGTIVTGFPAGIVCGVAGAVLGGIGGFIVGLFQGHPLRGAAIGAGKLATIGMVWGGFIGGGFIGYTVGSLIGLAAGEGQK